MQETMFDFKEKELMAKVKHTALSSGMVDFRTPQLKIDAKFGIRNVSLNK